MWHAYNLIREGDAVTATTFRKVQKDSGGVSAGASERIKIKIMIRVEDVDFDTEGVCVCAHAHASTALLCCLASETPVLL